MDLRPDDLLYAAHRHLVAHAEELLGEWRERFHPEPQPSARARFALEQLLLPRPIAEGGGDGKQEFWVQIRCVAARLAKLCIPLRQVNEALRLFHPIAVAHLKPRLGARAAEAMQALSLIHI